MRIDPLAELLTAVRAAVRAMEYGGGSFCEFCGGGDADLTRAAAALDDALLTYERLREVAPCAP